MGPPADKRDLTTFCNKLVFCSCTLAEVYNLRSVCANVYIIKWAPSSEFVSSSIPSWQVLTAHAQPFREARDLALCLKVPLNSLLVWASRGGSGKTARMRRLAWTFAARIGYKYQIRLTRSKWPIFHFNYVLLVWHQTHGIRNLTKKSAEKLPAGLKKNS